MYILKRMELVGAKLDHTLKEAIYKIPQRLICTLEALIIKKHKGENY